MSAAAPGTAPTFNAGERVLCYHGPLLYEAKVLKSEQFDDANTTTGLLGPHYRVHYKGWKQTWDEWVPPSRLLKWTDNNLGLQRNLQVQTPGAAPAKPKVEKGQPKPQRKETTTGRGLKRGRAEYEESTAHPEMRLQLPDVLKAVLVDDWEAVTKNCKLAPVPRKPNVIDILDQYQAWVISMPKPPQDAGTMLPTIISGLTLYFDRAIGANLLYRFERPQYAEMRRQLVTGPHLQYGEEKEMSSAYGAEHLLRMLVSLPHMVASSTMDRESVTLLRDYVNLLLQFMVENKERLFADYTNTTAAYQNISRA
ncbi:MRG-domain-containing protein [Auricularia subglabra TFB-10046 SS5]|nr:MRG-domain-containing protein [Auricularia subglabra TFB-10046 SS5]